MLPVEMNYHANAGLKELTLSVAYYNHYKSLLTTW